MRASPRASVRCQDQIKLIATDIEERYRLIYVVCLLVICLILTERRVGIISLIDPQHR